MAPLLTSEQLELKDSFRSFLAEHCSAALVRRWFENGESQRGALWKQLLQLAVLPYFAEPAAEGGGTLRELGLLAFEAGAALLPENLVDAALAVHTLAAKRPAGINLEPIVSGEL